MLPPLALLDAHGRFLWVNRTHPSLARDSRELTGRSFFGLASDPAHARHVFSKCVLEGEPQRLEGHAAKGDRRLNFVFDLVPAEIKEPVAAVGVGHVVRRRLTRLSPREKQVLSLLAEDLSIAEIARALHISRSTVESHLQNTKSKLGCRGVAGLVRMAVEGGLTNSL